MPPLGLQPASVYFLSNLLAIAVTFALLLNAKKHFTRLVEYLYSTQQRLHICTIRKLDKANYMKSIYRPCSTVYTNHLQLAPQEGWASRTLRAVSSTVNQLLQTYTTANAPPAPGAYCGPWIADTMRVVPLEIGSNSILCSLIERHDKL